MNFGTKGCMYNCGDECTGECIKVETKTKMSKEEDKKLVSKLLKEANEIHKNRKPKANFLVLTDKQIQDMADTQGITFDEMSRDIEEYLKPKQR